MALVLGWSPSLTCGILASSTQGLVRGKAIGLGHIAGGLGVNS